MQSEVPNCIARLDDAIWKLKQALRCVVEESQPMDLAVVVYLSSALAQLEKIKTSNPFKPPLSDSHPATLGTDVGQFMSRVKLPILDKK